MQPTWVPPPLQDPAHWAVRSALVRAQQFRVIPTVEVILRQPASHDTRHGIIGEVSAAVPSCGSGRQYAGTRRQDRP